MTKQGGIAAIVWAPYETRTARYARYLNASLYNIHYLRYKRPLLAPLKYLPQCLKTWAVLYQQRPSVVYVTNPPVFAALSAFIYCRLSGATCVMDTHSPSLFVPKWSWTVPLQRALAQRVKVNIVDQERFKALFESWGAKALVLQDPPIGISPERLKRENGSNQFTVTVVSTFDSDEPVELVVEAAKQLPMVRFFILGDTSRANNRLLKSAPDNVTFPGYLLHDAYWNQLYNSQAVMVLTTHPYSLLAGAQEGMVLEKPLLLSRQPALTNHFTKGAIFIDHSVESVVTGIQTIQAEVHCLAQEMSELAVEKREQWESTFKNLLALIEDRSCPTS